MEIPRAYVRRIDPAMFQRVVGAVERTGSYMDRNTVYTPVGVIGESQSGRFSDLFGAAVPEAVKGSELLLNSVLGFNGERMILAQRTSYPVWVFRHEPRRVTLCTFRADLPTGRRFMSSMDLSGCNIEEALRVIRNPAAIGTIGEEREDVAGFLGGDCQYLGIEEAPFT